MTEPHPESYWQNIRSAFTFEPGDIYLNNGSCGPLPQPVLEAQIAYARKVASQPFHHMLVDAPERYQDSRVKLADFVGAKPDDIAFVQNVTAAINMVAQGLSFKEGDELLTADQEYGAVNHCWSYVSQQTGLKINRVSYPKPPEDEEEIIRIVEEAITPNTKVISLSDVTTITGLVVPVKAICALAKERGIITVIDGAHGPGQIPVNLTDIGCDFYAATCNKWMLCPLGTGFLYASDEARTWLEPLIIGWGWRHGERPTTSRTGRSFFGDALFQSEFEALGTRDPSPFVAIATAIDFLNDIGIETISARGFELASYLRKKIQEELPGSELWTSTKRNLSGSLTAFLPDGTDGVTLAAELLQRYQIQVVSYSLGGKPAHVRVSTHFYNTFEELDILIEAIQDISG